MKQNQKGFGTIELFIILIVVALIIVAAFYFLKDRTRVAIEVQGQSFSFDIGITGEVITRSYQGKSTEYFRASPKGASAALVATIYKLTTSTADLKDTCKYDRLDAVILSKTHTVCDQKNKMFISNFDNEGTWYQVTVFPEDMKSELSKADAIKLVESIKSN